MGRWLLEAPLPPEGKKPFFGNKRFYLHMLLHAELALKNEALVYHQAQANPYDAHWHEAAGQIVKHVRVGDLKATEGGGSTTTQRVREWVEHNLSHVRRLFEPLPHRVVVQGAHAQAVFLDIVVPYLLDRHSTRQSSGCGLDFSTVSWTALPHPAAQLSYMVVQGGELHPDLR
ncbi:MAG: hypothetical protein VX405_07240, partial [Myxococcota bacterium]|nr:hypothetical protein [Myxococcota bacterium]